jgi:hypothetical protein
MGVADLLLRLPLKQTIASVGLRLLQRRPAFVVAAVLLSVHARIV